MVKRRKVALIYEYNENWIGGTYYIQNLVSALKILPDEQKPYLIILTDDELQWLNIQDTIMYPYAESRPIRKKLGFFKKGVNKINNIIAKKNFFSGHYFYDDIDVVFPFSWKAGFSKIQKFLYWIPDFQEHHLPFFFSAEEIASRKKTQNGIVTDGKHIVFSSHNAKCDFNKFYPENKLEQYVMQFAVTHTASNIISHENIVQKFRLPVKYFLCCNQFWQHKNHTTVLKAVSLLKRINKEDVFVVFTGKENDPRSPNYFTELKDLATSLHINENISFLGFIKREEQVALMKYAIAIIQPSLFEGWSTVIEDAKALNSRIIASDLDVHKEQLAQYDCSSLFLLKESESSLAKEMYKVINEDTTCARYDYAKDINKYGSAFVQIIEKIMD